MRKYLSYEEMKKHLFYGNNTDDTNDNGYTESPFYGNQKPGSIQNEEIIFENVKADNNENAEDINGNEVPRMNNNEMPRMNTNEMPRMNTNEVPRMNTNEMPRVNTNEMPRMNTNEVPRMNNNEMPRMNNNEMPRMNNNELPRMNTNEIPRMNNNEMPRMNTNELPRMNNNEMPRMNTNEIPRMNNNEMPRVNTNEMPRMNNNEIPRMNNNEMPRMNNNEVPRMNNNEEFEINNEMPRTNNNGMPRVINGEMPRVNIGLDIRNNNNIQHNMNDMSMQRPVNINYADVRIFHAAANYTAINATVGARTIASELQYGKVSEYGRVTEGYRTVTISSSVSNEILIKTSLPFNAGTKVTLAIVNTPTGIRIVNISDDVCRANGNKRGCIRAANLTFNEGPFNITLGNGNIVFYDIRSKEITIWKQAEAGEYEFYISETADLRAGDCQNMPCIQNDIQTDTTYILDFYLRIDANRAYTACIIGGYYSITPLSVVILEN